MIDEMNYGGIDGEPIYGVWPGVVIDNNDPKKLGRVTVSVPGLIDDESSWALPRAGGITKFGRSSVPPVGADVFVQFLAGRIEQPIYEVGPHGNGEAFPEHTDPEIHVFGIGPFRLQVDNREGQKALYAYMVKEINGVEERIAELEVNAETNSARLFATSALQLEAMGLLDLDCYGDVQVKGRKVMPRTSKGIG